MRLDFAGERVLAVVAHPDDAELLCAGTLARAHADGAAIGIAVLCQGDKGQPTPPLPNLAEVRRHEMAEAAVLLGADLLLGEFPDGGLTDGPEQRRDVGEMSRRFRPTLVLAHDPHDYHADHRAASALAEVASWSSTSPGLASPAAPLAVPPVVWWMDTINLHGFQPEFYVDITAQLDIKRRMLACHRSQLQRGIDTAFAPLEELMLQQARMRGSQASVVAAEAFRSHAAWKRLRLVTAAKDGEDGTFSLAILRLAKHALLYW